MIKAGIIAKPHGLKGEAKVFPFISCDIIEKQNTLIVLETETVLHISSIKHVGKFIVLGFDEINSIDELNNYIKKTLCIKKNQLDSYDKIYTLDEIIEFDVFNQNNICIGKLKDILKMPSQEVYVVSDGENEKLIPNVDEFILDVDLNNKIINVNLIKGM